MVNRTDDFQNKLAHAHAAYAFAVKGLPDPADLQHGPIDSRGFRFTKESQIRAMLVQLGWAFFCRYEGCLEAELKRLDVQLSKKCTLADWLKRNNVSIPKDLGPGIKLYRSIRNKLHHEDGAALNGDPDNEIHLLPEHMDKFLALFQWIGKKAACAG